LQNILIRKIDINIHLMFVNILATFVSSKRVV
jgi:hypothetical protein